MNHFATPGFWFHYRGLPDEIRELADNCFALLRENQNHPSLRFKKVGKVWSARVGLRHRALARQRSEGFVWFWIGPHDEYERLIAASKSATSPIPRLPRYICCDATVKEDAYGQKAIRFFHTIQAKQKTAGEMETWHDLRGTADRRVVRHRAGRHNDGRPHQRD